MMPIMKMCFATFTIAYFISTALPLRLALSPPFFARFPHFLMTSAPPVLSFFPSFRFNIPNSCRLKAATGSRPNFFFQEPGPAVPSWPYAKISTGIFHLVQKGREKTIANLPRKNRENSAKNAPKQ